MSSRRRDEFTQPIFRNLGGTWVIQMPIDYKTIAEFSCIDEAIKYLKRFLKVKKDELEKIINNYHSNA